MLTEITASRQVSRRVNSARPSQLLQSVRGLAGAATSAAFRRKGTTLTSLILTACVAAVSWNALMAQRGPHPYPLFGVRVATPARAMEPAPAPLPVSRPKDLADATVAAPPKRAGASSDPIGELIRVPETASIRPPDAGKSIAAAQRSLVRLGYGPLKMDGVMGQGTRLALERFERDNKLPPSGVLGPRTSRLLVVKAGAALE